MSFYLSLLSTSGGFSYILMLWATRLNKFLWPLGAVESVISSNSHYASDSGLERTTFALVSWSGCDNGL